MKTILQALSDEIHYPLGTGFFENRLLSRGLYADEPVSTDIINSNEFQGTIADCLYSLITAPNFSESDISISLTDKDLILKRANSIYEAIGEEPKYLNEPMVFIGGR